MASQSCRCNLLELLMMHESSFYIGCTGVMSVRVSSSDITEWFGLSFKQPSPESDQDGLLTGLFPPRSCVSSFPAVLARENKNEDLSVIPDGYEYVMLTSITFAVLRTRRGISFSKRSSCIRLIGAETLTAPRTASF